MICHNRNFWLSHLINWGHSQKSAVHRNLLIVTKRLTRISNINRVLTHYFFLVSFAWRLADRASSMAEVSNFNLQVVSFNQCLKRLNSISKSFVTKTLNLGRTFLIQLGRFVCISDFKGHLVHKIFQ